jgi:hypothetical protein
VVDTCVLINLATIDRIDLVTSLAAFCDADALKEVLARGLFVMSFGSFQEKVDS